MTVTTRAASHRRAAGAAVAAEPVSPWRPRLFWAPSAAALRDLIANVALTALTLAGVFSLSRLFVNHAFAGRVVLVAVGAHAVAWLCRHQGWPPLVAVLLSIVAVTVLTSWAVLPGSTSYGLPLLGTFHAAGRAVHHAAADFHQVTAPAPVTEGFVLVSAFGVGVLATLADWAAFRLRATLEATVPSFALFVFCAAIGSGRQRSSAVIVEVSALLAFIVIHQTTVDQETSAWFANRTKGALGSSISAGAVIGLAVLIVALNLGFRLPGATHKGVIAWRASDGLGTGTRSTLSPLVDLHGRLLHPSPNPVFTVTSSQPEYWRETALDSFNGTDWNALSTYHSVGGSLSGGSTPTVGGRKVVQDFAITDLNAPWLPAAYRPVSVSGIRGVTYDSQSGSLISDGNSISGASYHVVSLVSEGDTEVSRLQATPAPAKGNVDRYLALPPLSAPVTDLAQKIVAGRTTEYDKALALQGFFRDPANFTYSLAYDYSGPSPLDNFLFRAHQGYCQQFAGAMAVLARAVGLPTRLAVGWTWGREANPGVYQVTDQEAHTWPEIYFSGVGWVPFEPTPGRGLPGGQNYTGVAPAQAGGDSPAAGATVTTVPRATPARPGFQETTTTSVPKSRSAAPKHHRNPWVQVLLWLAPVVAGLALLLGLSFALRWLQSVATRDRVVSQAAKLESEGIGAPPDRFARFRKDWTGEGLSAAKRLASRIRAIVGLGWLLPIVFGRRRSPRLSPEVVVRAELLLTWTELLDLLAWWGVRRHPSETHRELGHRAALELRGPLAAEPTSVTALLQLAEAAAKAEFGFGSLSPTEAEAAAINLAVVKRALVRSATAGQRLRRAVNPRLTAKIR